MKTNQVINSKFVFYYSHLFVSFCLFVLQTAPEHPGVEGEPDAAAPRSGRPPRHIPPHAPRGQPGVHARSHEVWVM